MLGQGIMDSQLNGVADVRVEGRDRTRLRSLEDGRQFGEERVLGQHLGVRVDALERDGQRQLHGEGFLRGGAEHELDKLPGCIGVLGEGIDAILPAAQA